MDPTTPSADRNLDFDLDFLGRVPSFSIIYFTGDVYEQVPTFLTRWGYSILSQASHRDSFFAVFDALGRSGSRSILHKATYRAAGGTVLLDPEMVMGVSRGELLDQFCAEQKVEALVAIWERVSETVIAQRRSGQGVLVDVCYVRGEPQIPPINAPQELVERPGPFALKAFLAAAAAPVGEVFGTISVWTFRLAAPR